jgi:putative nucleotidyltransferase with HDIG domain
MHHMAASGQKRTRSERVAALELPPGQWERAWASLRRRDVLGRIGLAFLAALLMGLITEAWRPPGAQLARAQGLARAGAVVVMIFVMLVLCGIYMRYRQRGPLASFTRLSVMLALAVITVALSRWASVDPLRAGIIPLMLFGMTMAIVYRQELAVLLCGVLALVLALATEHGLCEFVLLMGISTTTILNLGRIRSRSKLIYVGLFAGGVAAVLTAGLGIIDNQPLNRQLMGELLRDAALNGVWALLAGFLMTGLLPFAERLFGVLTDLSLLELGDVSHPLLQELVRRAPSTYNHSVTVGSIGEAAAESIGARGLLVRVGAYFHDIGKMLKPGYYAENQDPEENRHEALVPAMSSLIIIAHIKDGADLARQHHLPQPITDLIEQHHGTTRVGFFYERASEQKRSDPNGSEVDESTYRYPGPRPQTKEAAVLMLADNVESASRTLVDPTPARIESLVREVAERRLHGGQFDESGLTLRELRTIERSMVKSLTAIYHGRLKYPDQRTA